MTGGPFSLRGALIASDADGLTQGPFTTRDLSRIFEADTRALFTDIVHVGEQGRQAIADRLAAEVAEVLGLPAEA